MGVTLLHLNVLQFAQAGAQAVQQGIHVLGGVVGAEADAQRGADGQVIAACRVWLGSPLSQALPPETNTSRPLR